MLEDRFGDKLAYSKPVEFANNESEFVYSLRTKFTHSALVSKHQFTIRNFATRILHNIKLRPCPPTPNQIIKSKDEIGLDL